MTTTFEPLATSGALAAVGLLRLERAGPVLHIRLNRPAKRNAVSDELLAQLHTVFVSLPKGIQAAIISGQGDHFCAGLDLSEVRERTVFEGMQHSRSWHACFDADEGQTFGISNYRAADGAGLAKALELATRIAGNAPLSNYAITQALPRIADLSASDGLFLETLMSSIAQGDEAAKDRVRAFLEKRASKVSKS